MKIATLPEIQKIIDQLTIENLVSNQEAAFTSYSNGLSMVPPVGHLEFSDPPGDCHIKYGYITGDDVFAIKVATGFYQNPKIGLPSGDGLILLFHSKTGALQTILLDAGHLTNIRTAIAGRIAAKYLAPKEVRGIGIFGTGTQARLQLQYLKAKAAITECPNIWIWGRANQQLETYRQDMDCLGLHLQLTTKAEEVVQNCNLLITTTASKQPIFDADCVQPGTHVTAIGADSPSKQELDPRLFQRAGICVVDSTSQCCAYGDTSHSINKRLIARSKVVELGKVIADPKLRRNNDRQITVADLTGIATQDIKMALLVADTMLFSPLYHRPESSPRLRKV